MAESNHFPRSVKNTCRSAFASSGVVERCRIKDLGVLRSGSREVPDAQRSRRILRSAKARMRCDCRVVDYDLQGAGDGGCCTR
jgi:hypothetical protein